jgi:DNA-binding SARP family transcriptional activator
VLRLTTFGGVALLQDGAPHTGPASQRRRLALLALVAAAGQRGMSRVKLFGLLWPDSTPDAARHALDQSLHMIRRSLGVDALFDGTTTLRLNAELLSSDVAEFDEAIARGAHEQAVRLYAGPFLDGFFLDGVAEFERWADAERARISELYRSAMEALATHAAEAGDHATARGQLRRWTWGMAAIIALLVAATWDMVFKPGL